MASNRKPTATIISLPLRRAVSVSLCGLWLLSMAACADETQYLARDDRIHPKVGDAVKFNKAAQTLDPWSDQSFLSRNETDGKRIANGIRKYETGESQ